MALLKNNNTSSARWFDVDVVPESYLFPDELRPGKINIEKNKPNIFPVIDLSKVDCSSEDNEDTIKKILQACQEFGVFQVINHGFSEELIEETIGVMKEFFSLPVEEKVCLEKENGWIYLSNTDFAKDDVHLWRENVKLPSHPLEDCMQYWPGKPSMYREVMATYLLAIQRLSSKLLELICEGLGLGAEYLKEVSEVQLLSSNHYPQCPDPSLTLGLLQHKDPSLITILYQGNTSGLQVLHDEEWFGVAAFPNAFVVNIGNQLEIISNGMLKSPEHRVVTNVEKSRTSIATFTNPSPSYIVKPATALIGESNLPLFKPTMYEDYINGTVLYGTPSFGVGSEKFLKVGKHDT